MPSSLCGIVVLKTTYRRTDIKGALCDGGIEIIGPIASNVEDIILIYATILGSSPVDKISLHPVLHEGSSTDAPTFWLCEECERKKLFSPTENNKELTPESLTQKDSILIKKNTRASKCPIKTAFATRFNFKEKRVNKGRTKYISCEEAVKLSSGAFSPKHVGPPVREKSLSKIYDTTKSEPPVVVQKSTAMKDSIKPNKSFARVETTKTGKYDDMRKDIEVPKSFKKLEKTITQESTKTVKSEVILPIKEEADIAPKSFQKVEDTNMETGGNNNHADVEAGSYGEQNLTVNEMQDTDIDTSISSFHSYWKGSFYLPNEHEKLNGAFKAHPPSRVHAFLYSFFVLWSNYEEDDGRR